MKKNIKITNDEKQFAYFILSDVDKSTNAERELELKGILKCILVQNHNYSVNDIKNIEFDFSAGQIKIYKVK